MPADRQAGNTGLIGLGMVHGSGRTLERFHGDRAWVCIQNSMRVFLGTVRKGYRIYMGMLVMIPEDRGFLGTCPVHAM